MQIGWFATTLVRELRALARELEAYSDERDLWRTPPGIANSAGTLALHLCGNLQHYVGARLGGTGYLRDRTAEFAARDLPRSALLARIEATIGVVERTLGSAAGFAWERPFPELVANRSLATGDFLLHLVSHLAFHLGQVDYHRRLVTGDPRSVAPVAVVELASARDPRGP